MSDKVPAVVSAKRRESQEALKQAVAMLGLGDAENAMRLVFYAGMREADAQAEEANAERKAHERSN